MGFRVERTVGEVVTNAWLVSTLEFGFVMLKICKLTIKETPLIRNKLRFLLPIYQSTVYASLINTKEIDYFITHVQMPISLGTI